MADRTIKVRIQADNDASAQLADVAKQIRFVGSSAEQGLSGLAGLLAPGTAGFLALGGAIGAVLATMGAGRVISAFVDGIGTSVKASAEAEVAQAKLQRAIANAGQSMQEALPFALDLSRKYQGLTGVSDEVIQRGESLLISLGRLRGEGLERATKAALDLGAKSGDVAGAFNVVARAAVGQTTMLARMGIVIDEDATKTEKFEQALTGINRAWGGLAQAQAQTFTGQLNVMKETFNDLQEAIGGPFREVFTILLRDLLVPVTRGFADAAGSSETFRTSIISGSADILQAARPIAVFADTIVAARDEISAGLGLQRIQAEIQVLSLLLDAFSKIKFTGTAGITIPSGLNESALTAAGSVDTLASRLDKVIQSLRDTAAVAGNVTAGYGAMERGAGELSEGLSNLSKFTAGASGAIDDLTDSEAKAVLGSKELGAALARLGEGKIKLDTVIDTAAINDALRALDRIEVKGPNTEFARQQVNALREQLVNLKNETADPLEVILKASGLDTMTKLRNEAEQLGKQYQALGIAELQGPKTKDAEDALARVREGLDAVAARLLSKLPALEIPGLDQAAVALARLNSELQSFGFEPLGAAKKQADELRQALELALSVRGSAGIDDRELDATIEKMIGRIHSLELPPVPVRVEFQGIGPQEAPALEMFGASLIDESKAFQDELRNIGVTLQSDVIDRTAQFSDLWAKTQAAVADGLLQPSDLESLRDLMQGMVDDGQLVGEALSGWSGYILSADESIAALQQHALDFVGTFDLAWTELWERQLDNFSGLVGSIVLGEKNLAENAQRLVKTAAADALAMLVKLGLQRLIVSNITKTGIASEHAAQLSGSLAAVFANAFASTAAIPIIGPALAPGVAAASLAAATAGSAAAGGVGAALGSGLGGFATGGKVQGVDTGRDSVAAVLRPNEIVLDVETSRAVESVARSAGVIATTGPGGKGLTREFKEFLVQGPAARTNAPAFALGGRVPGISSPAMASDVRRLATFDRQMQIAERALTSVSVPAFFVPTPEGPPPRAAASPQGADLPLPAPMPPIKIDTAGIEAAIREGLSASNVDRSQPIQIELQMEPSVDRFLELTNAKVRRGAARLVASEVFVRKGNG